MLMTLPKKLATGAVVAALAALGLASGPLFAQTSAPEGSGTPTTNAMGMMGAATPEAGDPKSGSMEEMMEKCMAMMEKMEMMGGEGMPEASPVPSQ